MFDLKADPPAVFAEGSQDFTTDGAYLTLHARNAILTGSSDPFGFEHWIPFKVSLVSGLSYLMFLLFGVSRNIANLGGIILNLGALIIFVIALRKYLSDRGLLIAAFFLAANFVLWLYGRLPFSENAMLFMAALAFLVFTYWFDRLPGKAAVGILISLCGLLGKSFGFLLVVGPLVTILASSSRNRFRDASALVVPFLLIILGFVVLVYRGQEFLSFLWEHGAGEHGAPHGFASVGGYFENLISFARTGLHKYTPVLSLLAWSMVLLLVVGDKIDDRSRRLTTFMLSWLAVWLLVLSPFNYRPLRYMYVLIVPMAALAGALVDRLPEMKFGLRRLGLWWRVPLLLGLCWYLAFNVVAPFVHSPDVNVYYRVVWYTLPAGAVLTVLLILLLRKRSISLPASAQTTVLIAVLVAGGLIDSSLYYRWYNARTYGLADTNRDVARILGSKAVVSGQYGPAVAEDGRAQCFPFFVTPDVRELSMTLSTYPITHLVVSSDQWQALAARYPELKNARLVTSMWLRDLMVTVYRVNELSANKEAARYVESDFELGIDCLYRQRKDSARLYFERFLQSYPDSKAALVEDYYLLAESGYASACLPIVDTLVNHYPTDFVIDILGAVYYKWKYGQTNEESYGDQAQSCLNRAIRYNPANEANLRKVYDQFGPTQLTAPQRGS